MFGGPLKIQNIILPLWGTYGRLHWMANKEFDNSIVILSFDLITESFTEVPYHAYVVNQNNYFMFSGVKWLPFDGRLFSSEKKLCGRG
ncbi:hypothetical protein LIER_41699 [Lithospermum erythrorhizon]|uniref:Uncharacterized protein n=1 Tax=Lithospermum erythrorhizon TaxID=34254 RepID=A0AAV3RDF4_LITER